MPTKKRDLDDEPVLTYHGMTEARFLPGLEALSLVESVRGNLPESQLPEGLVVLSKRQPGLYATFLGKLIAGSSFRAAAMACGINYHSLLSWLKQGAIDLSEELDTYCGRLLLDCQRAASLAICDAEERVHRADPSKWLGRGPGKMFFKGEYWSETPSGRPLIEEGQAGPEDPLDPEVPQKQIESEVVEVDDSSKDLSEALKVLEDHQIVNTPEFFKHAREQFKLPERPNG